VKRVHRQRVHKALLGPVETVDRSGRRADLARHSTDRNGVRAAVLNQCFCRGQQRCRGPFVVLAGPSHRQHHSVTSLRYGVTKWRRIDDQPISTTKLAYEDQGSGVPLILLHGLTFNRFTWSPIIERLGESVRTVAIDLPGHGDSPGEPRSLWEVTALVHEVADGLGIERPIVVGHSMSAAIACIYGASYPALGVVSIDQSADIRPLAQIMRRLEPALRGPSFTEAFQPFQQSMGLDRVSEPTRSRTLAGQRLQQKLVIGYWEEMMRTDPQEMQQRINGVARRIACPYLAMFGRRLEQPEREHLSALVSTVQIEEWPGSGHFLHLAEPERFSERLRKFIEDSASEEL
jgi:pimeloyl-ACP methyl ester carboxylesterase